MAKQSNAIGKIAFINNMIEDAIQNDPEFDVMLISNGVYSFHEVVTFLADKGLFVEFSSWLSKQEEKFIEAIIAKKELVSNDDLPFDDLQKNYDGGNKK